MQFHPTVLYIAGSSRNLITEAMRGEGAHLVDRTRLSLHARLRSAGRAGPARRRQPGDRGPDGKDAASERLSRPAAISTPIAFAQRFPGIAAICAEFGIDIALRLDPGAARGPLHDRRRHGRLGRPHVAARLVGRRRSHLQRAARRQSAGVEQPARRAGLRRPRRRGASQAAAEMADDFRAVAAGQPAAGRGGEPLDLADIRNSLKSLMWRAAGVRREGAELAEAAENIDRWCRYVLAAAVFRSRGLGIAKHADRGPDHDRGGLRARGNPRSAPPDRFSGPGQPSLAAADRFPARFFLARPIQGPARRVALDRGTIDVVPSRARVIAPPRGRPLARCAPNRRDQPSLAGGDR